MRGEKSGGKETDRGCLSQDPYRESKKTVDRDGEKEEEKVMGGTENQAQNWEGRNAKPENSFKRASCRRHFWGRGGGKRGVKTNPKRKKKWFRVLNSWSEEDIQGWWGREEPEGGVFG